MQLQRKVIRIKTLSVKTVWWSNILFACSKHVVWKVIHIVCVVKDILCNGGSESWLILNFRLPSNKVLKLTLFGGGETSINQTCFSFVLKKMAKKYVQMWLARWQKIWMKTITINVKQKKTFLPARKKTKQ